MSSADESAGPTFKKRKLQRACDYCRRKKVADDANYSYVEELESRLERMERLINKLCPETDVANRPDIHESDNDPPFTLLPTFEHSGSSASRASPSTLAITPPTLSPDSPENDPRSDEEEGDIEGELAEGIRKLSIKAHPFRYHGRSSGMVFIRAAIAMKNELTGSGPAPPGDQQHPWVTALVEDDLPMFEESSFPPRELLDTLVDLYFRHENCHYPLLHEPTFKKCVKAGQHLRNGGFGATVLLVCAIGSRFSRDPRVLLPGSAHHHSAGWKWFTLVERARRLSFAPAKLHDLQVYALMAMFLDGTAVPQATWPVIGVGIRAAVEVGVHRKMMYAPTPNVEEELWRRAFWTLVLLEWMSGHAFGRPCSIHAEDFDLALPTECDDEYWLTSDGEPLFKQPPGKPSKVSGFVYMIRLCQGLAFANRTIYATNKSRAQQGHSDEQWEQRIVAELDSALNNWADSLPSHLRWNPEEENEVFLTQAATLAAWHRGHQIAVHRSFMSSSRRESPISPPSTIICTNAARATIHIADVLCKRRGSLTHRNTGMVFMAAIVLMTNLLGLKRAGRAVHMEKDVTLVRRTAEMLRASRYETHYADVLADSILCDLISGVTVDALPRGAVAISFEGQPHALRTDSNDPLTGRQQTTTTDVNRVGEGSSFASFGTFVSSEATSHRPSSPEALLSDTSPFTMLFPPAGPNSPTHDLLSVNRPTHRGPPEHLAPPTFLPANAYGFSPLLPYDPLQPRASGTPWASVNRGPGPSQGDAAGGWMFGLEPLGYKPSMPGPSFLPPVSPIEGWANDHVQANRGLGDAAMQLETGGDQGAGDNSVPDFTLMDDALTMWSSMSPTIGWDEWGASFMNANNTNTNSSG
ncbi:transcription factor [Ganoderma sinense ZZ0214-1]|uniref:Transcription factor n=1 Tax=Ganoderma sinense ZZ0214-1 TaxID=1077348 RepID=A0A2G8RVB0_9APHY|nr:transcription factor [Ganoderma sinense ZZ0214-1]